MPSLIDARFDALRTLGYAGTTDEMLLQWAQGLGATANQTNDAIVEALLANEATTANFVDAWYEALVAAGYVGSRVDMEYAFWLNGGTFITEVTRNVLTWDGTSTYGTLSGGGISFTGDFDIQVDVVVPDETATGTFMMISGASSGASNRFGVLNSGQVEARISSVASQAAPTGVDPYDGKVHRWILSRVGTVGKLTIDGITQLSWTVPTTNSTWETVGNSGGSLFFAGEILNIKYADNGSDIQNYEFDSGNLDNESSTISADFITFINVIAGDWEIYTRNGADTRWESASVIPDSMFDGTCGVEWLCNGEWTISGGVANHVTSVTIGAVLRPIPAPISVSGFRYESVATVSNYVSGIGGMSMGNSSGSNLTSNGTFTITQQVIGASGFWLFNATLDFEADVDNYSVIKLIEDA